MQIRVLSVMQAPHMIERPKWYLSLERSEESNMKILEIMITDAIRVASVCSTFALWPPDREMALSTALLATMVPYHHTAALHCMFGIPSTESCLWLMTQCEFCCLRYFARHILLLESTSVLVARLGLHLPLTLPSRKTFTAMQALNRALLL